MVLIFTYFINNIDVLFFVNFGSSVADSFPSFSFIRSSIGWNILVDFCTSDYDDRRKFKKDVFFFNCKVLLGSTKCLELDRQPRVKFGPICS